MDQRSSLRAIIFSLGLLFCVISIGKTQTTQTLKGRIINQSTKEIIPYASVSIPSLSTSKRKVGVSSGENGEFALVLTLDLLPIELEFSAIGYRSKRFNLTKIDDFIVMELEEQVFELDEFVVSGEKIEQEKLRSPIQIEKLELAALRNTASFNFTDAVMNMKGVDVATQSIIINTVNARGFNSSTNQRFKQFTDGIDSQAPGLGFSLGNVVGATTLDVESLELIPGPTTARFGQGIFNGVLDVRTKNPFEYQGLSLEAKGASIRTEMFDPKFFTFGNSFIQELSARYAKAIVKDKIAFKINASRLEGEDFRARNYTNIGPGFPWETEHYVDNQGVNGVNVYGDDRAAFLILPRNAGSDRDSVFAVTRSGYQEGDLVDYNAESVKLNGALHFKLNPETEVILAGFYGKASTMITTNDRIALRDFEISQYKAEIKGKNFTVRGYTVGQNSGDSFNVGLLGETLVQTAKPDDVWFNQFENLWKFGGLRVAGRGDGVRLITNSGAPGNQYDNRYVPGTAVFDSLRTAIITSQEPSFGAAIYDRSKAYYGDAEYKINKWDDFFESLIVGANVRQYDPESNGTIFADSPENDITNYEYGFYTEASKKINEKVELSASVRLDKNENFDFVSSQRFSYVREFKKNNFFRASLQRGVRLPNIQEQFLDQNLGDTRLIGGLRQVVDPYDLPNNAIFQRSIEEFNQAVADDVNDKLVLNENIIDESFFQIDLPAIRRDNQDIIERGIVDASRFNGIKPERITSFEIGYRSLVEDKRVFEIIYYRNYYNNFIGNTRVVKPRTSPSTDLTLATEQANNPGQSELFFITDNSDGLIVTEGLEMMYDVTSDGGTNFGVNVTYANIGQDSDDPLTPNFNTPPFKLNFTVGHRKLGRHLAAQLSWRFRSEFEWESAFVDGTIPDYHTLDFQITYKIPTIKSAIRIGGNNVLNREQFNNFGGAEISSYYYISFTFDNL
ncbi:carboxypeptidase-like regulatory domain-containing protein [Roseivirga sp.]|uniref:carboxypeptidase-like regulatory domain-containing protein n=1 Tax=Roseivirga sp. TaxID=1964215 RepID=UPI003B8CBFA5